MVILIQLIPNQFLDLPNTQPISDQRAYVVGVVSRGDDCAGFNQPGIYTNIKEYLDWIEENSKDGSC